MAQLPGLLQQQQQDVARREAEASRFHTSLAHSRVTAPAHRTLPEVQRLAAGDEEWVQLMAQISKATGDVLAQLTPDGAAQYEALGLGPKELHLVTSGLTRDSTYAKDINQCLATLGQLLLDPGFVDPFMALMETFCVDVLGELKDSMAELQRTYHTECHAVEMATDTARQLQRTAPRGSAEDHRQCAARVLLVPLSLYHDLVQDSTPPFNERRSAERFLQDFERRFKPMLLGHAAMAGRRPESVIAAGEWGPFWVGLRKVAEAVIVSGTCLINFGATAKVLEMRLRLLLRDHVQWERVQTRTSRALLLGSDAAFAERCCHEVDKMALLLSHYDINRYAEENTAARAAAHVRRRLQRLSGDDEDAVVAGPSAPWDFQLRDFSWRTGFFVLAGQSLRMMGELNSITTDSGRSFPDLFRDARRLCEDALLDSAREALRALVAEGCTAVRRPSGKATKGALYNVLFHWLKHDLSFVAGRDPLEAQHCLEADHPGHPGSSLGALLPDAGKELLHSYSEWVEQLLPVQRIDADGVTHLEEGGPSDPEHLMQKQNAGVVLMFVACQQDGWREGPVLTIQELLRDIAKDLKLT